jgi:ATP-dependent Lhr-like helicase
LSIGHEAERSLGWRNFMDLTGIVTSEPEIVVRYGQTEIGRVHPLSFRSDDAGYAPILLGGRSWQVARVDWRRGVADVIPDPRPGHSRWDGDARPLRGELSREMRACAAGADVAARLSERAHRTLDQLHEEFWWAEDGATAIVADSRGNRRWWTFAGLCANAELADRLGRFSRGNRSRDNLSIGLTSDVSAADLDARVRSLRESEPIPNREYTARELPKFGQCLPRDLAATVVRLRNADPASLSACLAEPVKVVSNHR